MFLTAPPAVKPVASVTFRGAHVELDFDKGSRTFSLTSKSHGKIQRLRFREDVEDYESENVFKSSGIRIAPIGVEGRSYLVVTLAIHWNSGGLAGAAHAFAVDKGRLKEVGQLASNQMFVFVKFKPGHQALARSYEVGSKLSHAGMPRWQEYFQVRDGHLVQLTRSAVLFKPWMAALWDVLLSFPDESDCWHYYGLAAKGAGSTTSPRAAYRKMLAERAHWNLMRGEDKGSAVDWLRGRIRQNTWPKASRGANFWFDVLPGRELR